MIPEFENLKTVFSLIVKPRKFTNRLVLDRIQEGILCSEDTDFTVRPYSTSLEVYTVII